MTAVQGRRASVPGRASLRRAAALTLAGAGAFLLTLVPLLRGFVHDRVIRMPLEHSSTSHLYTASATYFDTAAMRSRTGPVVLTRALNGDAAAGDDDRAVWLESSSLDTGDGDRIDYHERKVAFDRRTGAIVNCCGEYVDDDPAARQSGLAFRWPFDARKQDYAYFDPQMKRTLPMVFDGVESVDGVTTYRYRQHVPATKVEDVAIRIPGTTLGLRGDRSFTVTRWAQTERTVWVEPVSGVPVKSEENRREAFRTADGVERLVVLAADLRTPANEIALNEAEAAAYATWSRWLRTILPIGAAGFGLLLIGAGIWASRRRPRSAPAQDEQQVPRDDLADPR
ncbi:hypothetical protein GCM10023194_04420 [Planotetraspora phitsanulokensis]|uniref:DUF3068 domain-containing protein n=1 Tax=Planotetraspora phitsanulokensis TaxID=575192 RepID=A0A8J3XGD9_9ACTN|nr:DUF3068 domain-containing protein [Planotetraspora phitsanulokensis]GII40702.1 hypothetical protein Pph01_57050 [Planotetraspora phitsanulokensis]